MIAPCACIHKCVNKKAESAFFSSYSVWCWNTSISVYYDSKLVRRLRRKTKEFIFDFSSSMGSMTVMTKLTMTLMIMATRMKIILAMVVMMTTYDLQPTTVMRHDEMTS